jgi:hypothetical protein
VNDRFHESYDGAREEAKLDGPVFVVLADELVVFRRHERRELAITPRIFHVIKSVAHAPVALYAALHRVDVGEPLPVVQRRAPLLALRERVKASLAALREEKDADRRTLDDMQAVLEATLAFADRTSAAPQRTAENAAENPRGPTRTELDAFARELGDRLLRLTAAATRVQLAALDARVEEALAELDDDERRHLQVVVTGDHQARVRSLGMQYFRKRFGEPAGTEERVSYAEGVTDAEEALALVGTRRLDSTIAEAFFGDPKRLQRDVLGDAVDALLEEIKVSIID